MFNTYIMSHLYFSPSVPVPYNSTHERVHVRLGNTFRLQKIAASRCFRSFKREDQFRRCFACLVLYQFCSAVPVCTYLRDMVLFM